MPGPSFLSHSRIRVVGINTLKCTRQQGIHPYTAIHLQIKLPTSLSHALKQTLLPFYSLTFQGPITKYIVKREYQDYHGAKCLVMPLPDTS